MSVATRLGDLRRYLQGGDESFNVWNNAVAFLRISAIHFPENDKKRGPLDDTRIHPTDYRFAVKVALDALDRTEDVRRDQDDEAEQYRNEVLREVMGSGSGAANEHYDDIVRVDVTGMAEAWKENYGDDKARVMQAMKEEMLNPFAEKRADFVEVTNEDAFWLTVGDSRDSLPEGKLVTASVRRADLQRVTVELDFVGLLGTINRDHLSDTQVQDVPRVFQRGMLISARVLNVDYERWEVRLTCKTSDLNNFDGYENPSLLEERVPYLRWIASETERMALLQEKTRIEIEKNRRLHRQGVSTMRVVDHPAFRNFTLEEVTKALEDAPVGETIFRPSTKGNDFLTMSYKGLKDDIVHVVIVEKDKPHEAALGRRLSIKGINEEYEDLDEIIARYVNPVTSLMSLLAEHRRFSPLHDADLEQLLRQEKAQNPSVIVYRLSYDWRNASYFKIAYIPANKDSICCEPISIRPGGYRLKMRLFPGVSAMLDWWKRHWNEADPKQGAAASSSASKRGTGDKREQRRR